MRGLGVKESSLSSSSLSRLDAARLENPRKAVRIAEEIIPTVKLEYLPDVMGLYGLALRKLARVDDAGQAIMRGVKLSRALGDLSAEARQLLRLGFAYSGKGLFRRALAQTSEALSLFMVEGAVSKVGHALVAMASFYEKMGHFELCFLALKRSLELLGDDDVDNRFSALLGCGYAQSNLGNDKRAMDFVLEAMRYEDSVSRALLPSRDRLEGRIRFKLSDPESAEEFLRRALEAFSELGNLFEAAYTTVELVAVLKALSRDEEAKQLAQSSARFLEPLRTNRIAGEALTELLRSTISAEGLDDHVVARVATLFEVATGRRPRKGNRYHYPVADPDDLAIKQLGDTRLEDPKGAIVLAEDLIRTIRVGNLPEIMGLYGLSLRRVGRVEEAGHAISRGLNLARALGDLQSEARQLQRSAFPLAGMGYFRLALSKTSEAIAIFQILDMDSRVGRCLVDLAGFFEKLEMFNACEASLKRALDLLHEDEYTYRFSVLIGLGYVHYYKGETELALRCVQEAGKCTEPVSKDLVASRDRLEGRIRFRLSDLVGAEVCFRLALEAYTSLGNIFDAAYSTVELVGVLNASDRVLEARELARSAASYLDPLKGNIVLFGALTELVRVSQSSEGLEEAVAQITEILEQAARTTAPHRFQK